MTPPPDDQLKALWQGQEAENAGVSIETIRGLIRKERLRRRGSIAALCLVSALSIPSFAWVAWTRPEPLIRAGYLLMLAGIGWIVWRGVRIWLAPPDKDSNASVLMDFHRAQLVRQRRAGGYGGTLITSAPMLVGLAVAVVGFYRRFPASFRLANMSVILGLIAVWCAFMVMITVRNRRRLQARVDDFDAQRR